MGSVHLMCLPEKKNNKIVISCENMKNDLSDFFFISWFTDPPTQIFAFKKKYIYIFDFFIFSDVKICQI